MRVSLVVRLLLVDIAFLYRSSICVCACRGCGGCQLLAEANALSNRTHAHTHIHTQGSLKKKVCSPKALT